jgi:hypothetical protein
MPFRRFGPTIVPMLILVLEVMAQDAPIEVPAIEPSDRGELRKFLETKAAEDSPDSKAMSDDELLDLIQRRTFDCFWHEADPKTFFIPDSSSWRTQTSIAGIGYQLGAYVVGHSRKYRDPEEIYKRVEAILENCHDDLEDPNDLHLENHSGHPYHWVNIKTGRWEKIEGVCTHDTVNYLCGVIVAKNYFPGTRAAEIAQKILDAVDWKWLEHGVPNRRFLSNMYAKTDKDQTGPGDVRFYDGMKFDYILPIGWQRNNAAPRHWDNWAMDYPWDKYNGHYWRIERPALWCHQWDSVWFDFRGLKDDYADYHQNSIEAALANRQWCIDNESYSEKFWGINPCAGPKGYGNFGAPPDDLPFQNGEGNDGTVTPTAALPCILWTPKESIEVARTFYDEYHSKSWRWFGFVDSINPKKNWNCKDWIAIDQGPIILNLENHRTGLLHRTFEKEPAVWKGLRLCNFVGVIDSFDPSEHASPYALWKAENANMTRDQSDAREGTHSLMVKRKGGGNVVLTARPGRRDISPFRYLSLWSKGRAELEVSVTAAGATYELPLERTIKSILGWERRTFSLPAGVSEIDEVRFELDDMVETGVRLDDIVLTHEIRGREINPLIDDFETKGVATVWKAGEGTSTQRTREGTLMVRCPKAGSHAVVEARPRFRDWRRGHSLAVRARGEGALRVELVDESGRKGYVGELESKGSWQTLHFNIQANFYPNTLNLKYDKETIATVRFTFVPKGSATDKIEIDDVWVTD